MMPPLKVLAVLLANLLVTALLGEFIVRMFYDPLDHLTPKQIEHEILTIQIEPGSAGHDDWGFRNRHVPESAQIVALGDSWTYGLAATSGESWPGWLQRSTGKIVYNLGVFGLGPPDYLYLLTSRGLSLDPELLVLGLSHTTDFEDAHRIVYGNDHWERLRSEEGTELLEGLPTPIQSIESIAPMGPWKTVRAWLRSNSMLYKIVEVGPIGRTINSLAGKVKLHQRCMIETQGPFNTYVYPTYALNGVNLESHRTREGLAITLAILREIDQIARARGIRFVVALLPTKERIYAGRLVETKMGQCLETFQDAVENEDKLRALLKSSLETLDIEYVDALPDLIQAARGARIFYASPELHPNAAGYRVVGDTIADYLSTDQSSAARAFPAQTAR